MLELATGTRGLKTTQRTKGESLAMGAESVCERAGCTRRVVTALGARDYCFDHFCSRCYELLERNQRDSDSAPARDDCADELLELDECARRALEISLGRVELNNLDRARLLDILLWSGDLTSSLRYRKAASLAVAEVSGKGRSAVS